MLLRDLITRLTFKINTDQIKAADRHVSSLRGAVKGVALGAIGVAALRAGSSFQELNHRLESLAGDEGNLKKYRDAIAKIPAAFSKKETIEGFIGTLSELGRMGKTFTPESVLSVLDMATLLSSRAGEDLNTLMPKIAGLMKDAPAMVEFLKDNALYTEETSFAWDKLLSRIKEGAGIMTRPMMIEMSRLVAVAVEKNREKLEKELEKLNQMTVRRVRKLWTDVWMEMSTLGVIAMKKPLGVLSDALKEIKDVLAGYKTIGEAAAEFAKKQSLFDMAREYRKTHPISTGARSFLEFFGVDPGFTGPERIQQQKEKELREARERGEIEAPFTMPRGQGKSPSPSPGGEAILNWINRNLLGTGGPETGGAEDIFRLSPKTERKPLGLGPITGAEPAALGMTINGGVHISVTGTPGMNENILAKKVMEEFKKQTQDSLARLGNHHIPNLESLPT